MKPLVFLTCLVILCQFDSVLCDKNELLNRYIKSYRRMKRSHVGDCQNPKQSNECTHKAKSLSITAQLPANIVPKSVIRVHLPINECNEPKDINNILSDIAIIAKHKNNTNGIQKIRNLVDEIAKQGETTVKVDVTKPSKKESTNTNVKTVLKYVEPMNHIETKETVSTVTSKYTEPTTKEQFVTDNAKIALKHEPSNEQAANTKETVLHYITVKEPIAADPIELKDLIKIEADKPVFTNERSNSDLVDHGEKTRSTLKDENLLKLKEHQYEEVLTRPPKEMSNLYNRQNYNYAYSNRNRYTGKGKYYGNYNTDRINNPFSTYENYNNGNKRYYYDSYNENTNPSGQQIGEENKDYTRYKQTEIDRDTVISVNQNEELVKSMNEDRKETMNIQSPYFHRKYYSVTQKRYSGDNGVVIQNQYYNQ